MKHVKPVHHVLSDLHAKKHKGEQLSGKDKIKHLIESEIRVAQHKHYKSMRNYVILFSVSLIVLMLIYIYNPKLPPFVGIINICAAIILFFVGMVHLNNGYKREISDYLMI